MFSSNLAMSLLKIVLHQLNKFPQARPGKQLMFGKKICRRQCALLKKFAHCASHAAPRIVCLTKAHVHNGTVSFLKDHSNFQASAFS